MSRTAEMDRVRRTIQGLCQSSNDLISNARLYEVFGLATEPEKARLRSRLGDLIRRCELIRVQDGIYSYNPGAAPQQDGEVFQRIWRVVRSRAPGFTYRDVGLISGASDRTVRRYLKFLIDEGFIVRHGKSGNTRHFRTTQKGKIQRETPFMPRPLPDPFKAERDAACRIVRALMEMDPYQPQTARKIATDSRIISDRFQTHRPEKEKRDDS